jgi:hypothetical protein
MGIPPFRRPSVAAHLIDVVCCDYRRDGALRAPFPFRKTEREIGHERLAEEEIGVGTAVP